MLTLAPIVDRLRKVTYRDRFRKVTCVCLTLSTHTQVTFLTLSDTFLTLSTHKQVTTLTLSYTFPTLSERVTFLTLEPIELKHL